MQIVHDTNELTFDYMIIVFAELPPQRLKPSSYDNLYGTAEATLRSRASRGRKDDRSHSSFPGHVLLSKNLWAAGRALTMAPQTLSRVPARRIS